MTKCCLWTLLSAKTSIQLNIHWYLTALSPLKALLKWLEVLLSRRKDSRSPTKRLLHAPKIYRVA